MGAQPTSKTKTDPVNQYLQRALTRLSQSDSICQEDKSDIQSLVSHLLAKGIGKHRVLKYVNHMVVVCRISPVPLRTVNRKVMEGIISNINTSDYAENTKHDYKVIVKKYFQWLRGCNEDENEYPEEVRWIKATLKRKHLLPEALLTNEELKMLVEAAENLRNKAFILTHYDSGCRIGETLGLKILHIAPDKYGVVLRVDGKTGPRRVRIIAAVPALNLWLNMPPFKNDPDAQLWVGVGTVGRNKALSYDGARLFFED